MQRIESKPRPIMVTPKGKPPFVTEVDLATLSEQAAMAFERLPRNPTGVAVLQPPSGDITFRFTVSPDAQPAEVPSLLEQWGAKWVAKQPKPARGRAAARPTPLKPRAPKVLAGQDQDGGRDAGREDEDDLSVSIVTPDLDVTVDASGRPLDSAGKPIAQQRQPQVDETDVAMAFLKGAPPKADGQKGGRPAGHRAAGPVDDDLMFAEPGEGVGQDTVVVVQSQAQDHSKPAPTEFEPSIGVGMLNGLAWRSDIDAVLSVGTSKPAAENNLAQGSQGVLPGAEPQTDTAVRPTKRRPAANKAPGVGARAAKPAGEAKKPGRSRAPAGSPAPGPTQPGVQPVPDGQPDEPNVARQVGPVAVAAPPVAIADLPDLISAMPDVCWPADAEAQPQMSLLKPTVLRLPDLAGRVVAWEGLVRVQIGAQPPAALAESAVQYEGAFEGGVLIERLDLALDQCMQDTWRHPDIEDVLRMRCQRAATRVHEILREAMDTRPPAQAKLSAERLAWLIQVVRELEIAIEVAASCLVRAKEESAPAAGDLWITEFEGIARECEERRQAIYRQPSTRQMAGLLMQWIQSLAALASPGMGQVDLFEQDSEKVRRHQDAVELIDAARRLLAKKVEVTDLALAVAVRWLTAVDRLE